MQGVHLIGVLSLLSCGQQPVENGLRAVIGPGSMADTTKVQRTLIVGGRSEVKGSLPGPCERFVYDYTGLYPIIDTVPVITEDSIYMDGYLKEAGMKVINSGWGNWQDGPRIFTLTLAMEACTCKVHKAYFYNEMRSDSMWDARVTERVVCNVADSLVPWWTNDEHIEAHRASSIHRGQLLASDGCGCFYCLEVFSPTEIRDWTDEDTTGVGQTALCPRCGIDAVIGSKAGYPLTKGFLARMNRHWF